MSENHSISICIITKNESRLLKQCLERLVPHAQCGGHEILITDTGSTDDTIEMCKAYTDSVYEFPWINDFSAARNFAAKHAKNDWILCIDSDEFITSWNETDLQRQIAKYPKAIGGFPLLCTCGFGQNQYNSNAKVYRLYNRKFFHFERPIHEQLEPFSPELGHPCFMLDIKAEHFSYSGSPEELMAKSERNIKLLKEELQKNLMTPIFCFNWDRAIT